MKTLRHVSISTDHHQGAEIYLQYCENICEVLSESKDRFAIQRYLLIIGKKQNMRVLSHTFTYFPT